MDKCLIENNLINLKKELNLSEYAINKYSKDNITKPNKEIIDNLYKTRLRLSIRLGNIKTELNKVESEIEQYLDNETKYENLKIYQERIPMLKYLINTLEGVLEDEKKRTVY